MSDTFPRGPDSLKELLGHRDYACYAAARFMATLAWQMLAVAVGWQTYEVTRDPLALGVVGLAQFCLFSCWCCLPAR